MVVCGRAVAITRVVGTSIIHCQAIDAAADSGGLSGRAAGRGGESASPAQSLLFTGWLALTDLLWDYQRHGISGASRHASFNSP